jgi:tetratricopeptide (TPR) repeat protein
MKLTLKLLYLSGFCYFLMVLISCSNKQESLSITYPFDLSVFPKDIAAPTFKWTDVDPSIKKWYISIDNDGSSLISKTEVKEKQWKPSAEQWKTIIAAGLEKNFVFAVERELDGKKYTTNIKFSISKDPVDAAIFFRGVPLPFKFARENIKKVKWYLGDIGNEVKPHAVLEDIPVCANCHSFSANGKTIAMDVDALDDKGAYVMSSFNTNTKFAIDSIISWGKFQDNKFTYGLLSQISPNGRYVISTLHDCEIFADRKNLEYSQLFFPFKGILVVYDRIEKRYFELPGANDTLFVQSNPCWTPDGKTIFFARARAKHFEESGIQNGSVPEKKAETIERYKKFEKAYMDRDSLFKFDIYSIPFNNGKGGKATPLKGASNNGVSNYFPRVSPDGKWLVFCQAESFMLLQKDSKLLIMPAKGGEPHIMECNSKNMNSWHSWSPNSKWLVFSSKAQGPYTQLYLTHINNDGTSTPPIFLENFSFENYANNIPEFTNTKYNKDLKIDPEFLKEDDFLVRQGEIALKKGDKQTAFEAFDKAVKKFPNNNEAYYNRGKLYYERNQLPQALKDMNKALELAKNVDYYVARGTIYIKTGDLQAAMSDLTEAIKIDSTDNKANSYLGIAYSQTGKTDLAIQYLRKAISRSKSDYFSNYILGRIYYSKGMFGDAIKSFSSAFEYCLDDNMASQILLLRGECYVNLNNFKSAMNDINEAIKLSPDNPLLYFEKGRLLLESGNNMEGIALLQKAEKLGSKEASELLKSMK